ncbi:restriction endonuclease subunit S [Helicobacter sp. 23-1045]
MQTENFSNLPKSWQIKPLNSFGIFIRGVSYKKEQLLKEKTSNSVFLLRANNIQEKLDLADLQIVPKELAKGKIIQDNDIVFAMSSGSKHIVGKNIILKNLQDYSFGAFCGLFRITNQALNQHYLAYFLQSDFYKKYIVKFAKGTNINNLRFGDLENLPIPLPPLDIQKRIVARLDEAFARIDNGTKHLKSAQNNITKYKQSLLKSAFNGTLTKEPSLRGSKATEATHSHRHCESLRQQGEAIHKKDIDCHDWLTQNLAMTDKESSNLPQGWTIKTLGEICEFTYGKGLEYTKRKASGKYPVYAANGIKDYSDEYMIQEPSIIVGRKGSVGSLVLTNSPCWVLDVSYYITFDKEKYNLMFLYYLLKTLNLNQYARGVKPGLSRSQAYELKVKIPPLQTQKQIVEILEKHFKIADKTSEFIESALKNAKQLKSSLLKSAFAGELV